jgi:hypothetical protein
MLLKFYHKFTCRYLQYSHGYLGRLFSYALTACHCSTQTAVCRLRVWKPKSATDKYWKLEVSNFLRMQYSEWGHIKTVRTGCIQTLPLNHSYQSGLVDLEYRKAQKSLGTRGTLSNIECQVTFATPGTYCELIIFSDFWYNNNHNNNNRFFSAARRPVAKVRTIKLLHNGEVLL